MFISHNTLAKDTQESSKMSFELIKNLHFYEKKMMCL